MSIIGNPIVTTNYISDSFSGDASTVAFTLSQAPASAASIAVYISGLYQIPTSAYSISGTTLTFTGAPPTGTNNITVLHLGVKSATLVPVAGSVTPQMLSNANVVYWSASNNNIGIGNTTPTSLLTVTGTVDVGNTLITGTANVSQGLTANTLTVSTNTVTVGTALSVNAAGGVGVNSAPTTGYKVTIDNGSPTTGDYSPLLIKGGSSSENGGQLGLWNTYAGVSNPKKWIRVDNSGKLGVVNSGYTAQIFSLDDSGNILTGGTLTTSSRGIAKASLPSGSVLQVQYSAPTNLGAVSRGSSTFGEISSSWRVSITPTSASSILRISCHFCFDTTGANSYLDHFKFFDITNSTDVLVGDANGSRTRCLMASRGAAYDVNDPVWMSFTAFVSAGSTNARTYGVYHKVESGNVTRTFFGSSLSTSAGWQTAPVLFVEEIAQ